MLIVWMQCVLNQNQNKNQNPLLTSLYAHNKYMAYVNSSETLTIYLVLVVHEKEVD